MHISSHLIVPVYKYRVRYDLSLKYGKESRTYIYIFFILSDFFAPPAEPNRQIMLKTTMTNHKIKEKL